MGSAPTEITNDGTQIWRNENGDRHREDGPAAIYPDGIQYWYINGNLHREDDPAVIFPDGTQHWYINGKRHREDGPAIIYPDGEQHWYINGNLHREDGPAIIGKTGKILEWFKHGFRHRENGPAIIEYDDCGNVLYETWYMKNAIHREDGPAYTNYFTGEFAYFCRGYLHRTDGVSQYRPRLPRLKHYHIHGEYMTDKFRKWCIDMNCEMCDENFQVFVFEHYVQDTL